MTAARSDLMALRERLADEITLYSKDKSMLLELIDDRLAASQPDREAIQRMMQDCQPATGTDVLTNAYERGRFDGVMEYANNVKRYRSLLSGAGTKSDGGKPLPIETAPRDGTSFIGIATAKGWSATKIARFLHAEDRLPVPEGGGMWPSPPTHWAPLPVVTFIPESDGPPSCADSGDIIAPPAKIPGPSDTPIADSSEAGRGVQGSIATKRSTNATCDSATEAAGGA